MNSKWLLIIGVGAAAAIALAMGVAAGTLLTVGAVLLCPAAMYFGMGGTHQGCCGHSGKSNHDHNISQSNTAAAGHGTEDRPHQRMA